ncbi:MAG: serine/threonine protein kinase [Methylococcaceae bacterium]|nr:serine/threonine protein kinase [Methylococcaceae bacterium]
MSRPRTRKAPDHTRLTLSRNRTSSDFRNGQRGDANPGAGPTRYRASHRTGGNRPVSQGNPGYSKPDYELGMHYTEKFSVRGMIGQGGTSRVLLGFDKLIGREVAIKELLDGEMAAGTDDSFSIELNERFEREIAITGQLEHPGIVPVYEAGYRNPGVGYYAMKYVRGRTLKEAVETCQSLSLELSFAHRMKLLDNVIDVCDAIAYAHSKNIIHRDIKPENIVIGRFGETVVIDWGLAKALDRDETLYGASSPDKQNDPASGELTQVDSIFGTPRYMAPEQAGGQTGKFSDVYSLGAVLFYVLTGKPVYSGTLNEVIAQLTSDAPSPSPQRILPFVTAELSAICEKAMLKDPAERFSDARELAEQLHAYRDGRLISAYVYSRGELFRRFVSRNKAWILAVAIVMIAVLGGAAASMKYAIEAHESRARADAALVDVTALSQMSIRHSQEITEVVERRLNELSADMDDTAKALGRSDAGNDRNIQIPLWELHSRYPNIDHFLIVDEKGAVTEYSPGKRVQSDEQRAFDTNNPRWIQPGVLTSKFGRVFDRGDNELYLPVQSPIPGSDARAGRLVALLKPTEFLSDLIFAATPSGKVRPQAWLMQDDGLILYDNDPKRVGANLYTDLEMRGSPTLQALAIRVKTEETGIGYYALPGENHTGEVDKVTAWDTIGLDNDLEWKIISYFEYQSH